MNRELNRRAHVRTFRKSEHELTKSVQSAIRKAVTEEAYGAAVMNALRD
jgi:hypothetical protein